MPSSQIEEDCGGCDGDGCDAADNAASVAPAFELLPCEGWGVEVEVEKPVGAGEVRAPVAPVVVPVPEASPISAPGSNSGVSPRA